jgi:hypothetical protein
MTFSRSDHRLRLRDLESESKELSQSLSRPDAKSAKENIFLLSDLGVLCVFARVISFSIPYSRIQPKIPNIFGELCWSGPLKR